MPADVAPLLTRGYGEGLCRRAGWGGSPATLALWVIFATHYLFGPHSRAQRVDRAKDSSAIASWLGERSGLASTAGSSSDVAWPKRRLNIVLAWLGRHLNLIRSVACSADGQWLLRTPRYARRVPSVSLTWTIGFLVIVKLYFCPCMCYFLGCC